VVERGHSMLYLTGEDRAGDLAGDLAAEGLTADTVVVYRAVKVSMLPPETQEAVLAGRVDGVLHFSRRSAEAFLAGGEAGALSDRILALRHYCISSRAAEPLMAAGAGNVLVADRPDERAMLGLIGPAC
jgi:uroporphyrinogen-III synthase